MFYYLNRKFVTEGVNEGNQMGTAIDMPKIRYADVLLNLAEALNEQGKIEEAISAVNQVRARAGAQLLNSNEPTDCHRDRKTLRRAYSKRTLLGIVG